jgi:hypothetical protein
MRDRIYLIVFLVGAGVLLYVGRGFIAMSAYATFGLNGWFVLRAGARRALCVRQSTCSPHVVVFRRQNA